MEPRVLLIQEDLKNYRDPIYSLIAKRVDLTVGYTLSNEIKEADYPIIQLPYRMFGPVIWHKNFRKTINQYDVIVYVPHLRMVRVALLPLLPHKPRLVTWSLGVHASYNRLYDLTQKPSFKDNLFETLQDKADACVFYMSEPIEYWKKYRTIRETQYFVAHNTVAVAPYDPTKHTERDIILFVGTLYQQKGLGELIDCYAKAKTKVDNLPLLMIVGKGPENEILQKHIEELGIQDHVKLPGAIYDEEILKEYFLRSVICVSPRQAGLTVLKSLGYGVPFVTRTDAITGGERLNIIHGKTGFFYDTEEQLTDILIETAMHPEKFIEMSTAARNYYLKEASPEGMAQGVVDAVMYALNQ